MRIVEPKKKPSGWKLLRPKFRKNGKDLVVKEEPENSDSDDLCPRNKTSNRSFRTTTKAIFKRSGGGTESLLQKSERESERRADDPIAEQRNPDTDFVTPFMSPLELTSDPPSDDDRVSSISDTIFPEHATVSTVITVMSTLSTPRVDCKAIPTSSSAISPSPQVVADFDPWEDEKSNNSENPWKSLFSENPFPHNQLSTLARPDPSQAVSKQSTSAGSDPSKAPPTVTSSESSSFACAHRSPQVLSNRMANKPSVLAPSDSSLQDPPSETRSKPSTLARSDPQVLFAANTRTPQVFRSNHSTTVSIHTPSVLEDSLTTHSEGTSQVESSHKTLSKSNRTNVSVVKAEESEPDTSRNASLPIYSPDLWKKGEEEDESEPWDVAWKKDEVEDESEPWDVASSKASVVVKAPMKAEESSTPKQSSGAVLSPTRLQTKALMRKITKSSMRQQPTVVANRQQSLLDESADSTFSEKINAGMFPASETKNDISVAEDILLEVDEVNAVMQDYSTGILSESKSSTVGSVAEEILADDSAETELIEDALELMLLESKKFGAISVAEEILADEFLYSSESKSSGVTSVAEEILEDDLIETQVIQNDWAAAKISDSMSFGLDWTEAGAVHNDWAELMISDSTNFGHASAEEEILADDLTRTEMIRDHSTESLVPPMNPLSQLFSSQSDCEMSLKKKAIAAAAAHKSRGDKAKVKVVLDESGLKPNDREEVTQDSIDDLNHDKTITKISSSDASEHDTGALKLLTEREIARKQTTGETMVATKLSKNAVLWTRIVPSSTQLVDGHVGTEQGPGGRNRIRTPEVSGSGLEKEEEKPSSSTETLCAAEQDEATPTAQSVTRSPERRHQKLQQVKRARRMLRSGLWQKPVLADRIVVQEDNCGGEGEVEVILETDVMPRKSYEHRGKKHNATASCAKDGSTSIYGESAWMDDFDGDPTCRVKNKARSFVAGPGSFIAGPEYDGYGSDSEDYSTGTEGPEEIWDEITELFKLQWRDAWQAV